MTIKNFTFRFRNCLSSVRLNFCTWERIDHLVRRKLMIPLTCNVYWHLLECPKTEFIINQVLAITSKMPWIWTVGTFIYWKATNFFIFDSGVFVCLKNDIFAAPPFNALCSPRCVLTTPCIQGAATHTYYFHSAILYSQLLQADLCSWFHF
jgi:hypothetical protein